MLHCLDRPSDGCPPHRDRHPRCEVRNRHLTRPLDIGVFGGGRGNRSHTHRLSRHLAIGREVNERFPRLINAPRNGVRDEPFDRSRQLCTLLLWGAIHKEGDVVYKHLLLLTHLKRVALRQLIVVRERDDDLVTLCLRYTERPCAVTVLLLSYSGFWSHSPM